MAQDMGSASRAGDSRTDPARRPDALRHPDPSAVRRRLLASGVFLGVQVAATDYGPAEETGPAAVFWFVVGAVLLWWVYRRRSRVARGIVVVLALTGAVIYALGVFDSPRAVVLAIAYLGQALPLLTEPVRRHVEPRP